MCLTGEAYYCERLHYGRIFLCTRILIVWGDFNVDILNHPLLDKLLNKAKLARLQLVNHYISRNKL